MDICLSCSLIFVSSLFSNLPEQTVNVWTQCRFDSVPSRAGPEGRRQRLMYRLRPGRQEHIISQSAGVTFSVSDCHVRTASDAESVGTRQRSNKKFPTAVCLVSRDKIVIGKCIKTIKPRLFFSEIDLVGKFKFTSWIFYCQ